MRSIVVPLLTIASSARARHPAPLVLTRRAALLACTSACANCCKAKAAVDDGSDALDGMIAKAAADGRLDVANVVERARRNELVDLKSDLSCEILDQLVSADRSACASAADTIKELKKSVATTRQSDDPLEMLQQIRVRRYIDEVETVKLRIDKQVTNLVSLEEKRGCIDSFATYDQRTVLERARRKGLSVDRVLQRAKEDQLLNLKGAEVGCNSLMAVRDVDRTALSQIQAQVSRARRRARAEQQQGAVEAAEQVESLLAVEKNLRKQLTKVDNELSAYCGASDLSAGAM